jgi:TrpR-related protein YerC/YecD
MSYRSKFADHDMDLLFDAMLTLKSKEDCYRFFEDLCTIKEIQDMALRLKVAKMLYDKIPYQTITKETNASTATISRVSKALLYGADGYNRIIKTLKEKP